MDVSKPKGNTQSFENEHRSVLFAQVIHGKPRMGINKDGFLEVLGKSRKDRKVFLGDVAKAMLHSLGSHETPIFTDEPNWDEQRWELTCKSNELNIKITSSHYWALDYFLVVFIIK